MIAEIIKPETELERYIISLPEFIDGALWGKPRNGHPEGKVITHIGHVLGNIDKLCGNDFAERRRQLRFVAIVHDTFKYKVDRDKSRDGENHHAMIARRFAEQHIEDKAVLDIIETHDEAYNAWFKVKRTGKWVEAEERAVRLIKRLGDNLGFYMDFYGCDNDTGDKSSEPYDWFEKVCKKTLYNCGTEPFYLDLTDDGLWLIMRKPNERYLAGTDKAKAMAIIERLNKAHRVNIEQRGLELYVCWNDHDRSEKCEYVKEI